MTLLRTVVVSGSTSAPSKTLLLARHILAAVAAEATIEPFVVDLAELGAELGGALTRSALPARTEHALRRVESAEILIAATPVYRGSYTGHFKHLFDLIDQNALIDIPVILAATGGSDKHCLVIEHQLRPLFGFLQSLTVPVGVYASPADIADGEVRSELVLSRIRSAARQAVQLASPRPGSAVRPPALAQTA
ncbi:MAG TPA: FMN reductase [Polyangiaceae bacterium]|jgi:FMN reductase|nr:FMN reductase [Polyangiaceae bacterium]